MGGTAELGLYPDFDAMRLRQGFSTQRMVLSNFDRYHPTLAVEANVPQFQDVSSD